MRNLQQQLVPGLLLLSAFGCGAGPESASGTEAQDPQTNPAETAIEAEATTENVGIEVSDPEVRSTLQLKVDEYVLALQTADLEALNGALSSEVREHVKSKGGDITAFQAKMFRSLQSTMESMGKSADVAGAFAVTKVVERGDTTEVSLAIDGEELQKPLFFVKEGTEYKYNVRHAGFSAPLPEGASPFPMSIAYQVKNIGKKYRFITGTCLHEYPWQGVDVGQTVTMHCLNQCGWWEGSQFTSHYDSGTRTRKCDRNTWGWDVQLYETPNSGKKRWKCHDEC